MFWAGRDPAETLEELKSLGVRCGQIGIPGDLDLACADRVANRSDSVRIHGLPRFSPLSMARATRICRLFSGRLASSPRPPAREREKRIMRSAISPPRSARPRIATHIGFVPEDPHDPDHAAVREMVRRICDYAAANGQKFALETGQEAPPVLLGFLLEVNRAESRHQLRSRQHDSLWNRRPG